VATTNSRSTARIAVADWGDGVISHLAAYLAKTQPGLRGSTARNLFRMRQFYEASQDQGAAKVAKTAEDATGQIVPAPLTQLPAAKTAKNARGQIVSALLRQLPWTHYLIILGQRKRATARNSSAIPRI
jgi:hypothetical protein